MSTVFNCLTGQHNQIHQLQHCLFALSLSFYTLSLSLFLSLALFLPRHVRAAGEISSVAGQLKITVKLCNKRIFISYAYKLLCRRVVASLHPLPPLHYSTHLSVESTVLCPLFNLIAAPPSTSSSNFSSDRRRITKCAK